MRVPRNAAEPLYKRALEIWNEVSGVLFPKPQNAALTLDGLAELYRKTDREGMAASLEKRAAAIRSRKR